MSIYYTGNETVPPLAPVSVKTILRDDGPENYVADERLAAAVNVALILGKPLLLTGEPGTGKTKLAQHVAMALGLGEPERFDTKSTSQATELFYRFDSLARFHAAHAQEKGKRTLDFVSFGPLGKAILRSLEQSDKLFSALDFPYPVVDAPSEIARTYPNRSVVLIDEIDKAPRDFPNDLLDALDNLRFCIRELERDATDRLTELRGSSDITAEKRYRPLVIITSNSEKNLPDPFLRRCVYFHIPFPDTKQLMAIVARQVAGPVGGDRSDEAMTMLSDEQLAQRKQLGPEEVKPLLRSAMAFFTTLREMDLRKRPSTAELIDWIRYLRESGAQPAQDLKAVPELVHRSLGVLVKSIEDLAAVHALAEKQFSR